MGSTQKLWKPFLDEMNKIEAYKQTKRDPQELVDALKKRFMAN
ncbi:hypothetical protein CK203_008169 [Vitis vinifera]|uniref:Uncharacterized protein n=1 Tax=Vitis vinifera TaxID=29760 RepID=A0A438G0W8_VITVI|nr:hypothetical protein CK203_007226 [Vitis vinifera]RVX22726.1 hypothetical protein CK203_008169 [Vitis vinifera]